MGRTTQFRMFAGVVVLAAVGSVTAGIMARRGAAPRCALVPIGSVGPNVKTPRVAWGGSTACSP